MNAWAVYHLPPTLPSAPPGPSSPVPSTPPTPLSPAPFLFLLLPHPLCFHHFLSSSRPPPSSSLGRSFPLQSPPNPSSQLTWTEPHLKDLALAFADLGINVAELSEFCQEVESTKPPQGIHKYPLPRKSTHVNLSATARVVTRKQVSRSSQNSSTSSDDEEDHVTSCLPLLPSKLTEKGESTVPSDSG